MLLLLYTLLLFYHLNVTAEKCFCRIMGDPKYPLFSKDGDIIIGSILAIHSKLALSSFEFTQKPQLISCSRFVTLSALVFDVFNAIFNGVFVMKNM